MSTIQKKAGVAILSYKGNLRERMLPGINGSSHNDKQLSPP